VWKYDAAVRLRVAAVGFVILLHAVLIHVLASSLSHARIDRGTRSFQVTFFEEGTQPDSDLPPELPPTFELPPVLIPPPEVVVKLETGPTAIQGEIAQPILGPRLDPNRPNPLPVIPAELKDATRANIVLRIQVLKISRPIDQNETRFMG